MQATVSSYDPDTRSGQVVSDTGHPFVFDGSTLSDDIRHLRPGQRVFIDSTDGIVSAVTIWR